MPPWQERYHDLPVYSLKEVLARVPLPAHCPLDGVSPKWRCVLVPHVAEPSLNQLHPENILSWLDKGIPAFLGRCRSQHAFDSCGPGGIAFVTDARWNRFTKPQIAVRTGYGAAGTSTGTSRYLKPIAAFSDVFEQTEEVQLPYTEEESKTIRDAAGAAEHDDDGTGAEDQDVFNTLSLQHFHREGSAGVSGLPALGESLVWPAGMDDGVVCELATSLSQRGAVRWWHINDCGELVLQAALPEPASASSSVKPPPLPRKELSSTERGYLKAIDEALYKHRNKPGAAPAKLSIYGLEGSYDWLIHDDETGVSGKVAALDLFNTPDEALPADAALLPLLAVAVLESNGSPLLVPPNLPTMTITLQDSVVVEQRRLAHLWLEDVSYFLHRCARWRTTPYVYPYMEQCLQDDQYLVNQLIPLLMKTFKACPARTTDGAIMRRRVARALFTILANEQHFGLTPSSRASLKNVLDGGDADMTSILKQSADGDESRPSVEEQLRVYWNLEVMWPKPGCVLRVPSNAVALSSSAAAQKKLQEWFIPVVYAASRPVFGTEKLTLEATVDEYFDMKGLEAKPRELLAYLRSRKAPADELLDELF